MTALWTAAEAEKATGGRSSSPWEATGVSIDTRTLEPGDLFVALKGPRFDGHDFIASAHERGAAAAMVASSRSSMATKLPLLMVDDTGAGLRALAERARERAMARRIGVTGSVGKTGTKEAIRHALEVQAATFASRGNLNNEWGVPLSLARMPRSIRYAVLEMGMNHPGEIAALTRLVRPHVAVITTIEPVHLEFFDSVAGIADAKAEIFEGMSGGTAVLNRDNAFFHYLAIRARDCGIVRVLSFGAHPEADARLLSYETEDQGGRVSARVLGQPLIYRLALPGRHWALNSLAALAVTAAVGADVTRAAAAFASLTPLKGRGTRRQIAITGGSFTLVDESYNASPPAVRAALRTLASIAPGPGGRRIVVLGDMLELGATGIRQHTALTRTILDCEVDLVYTTGPLMGAMLKALPEKRQGGGALSSEETARAVVAAVRPGDVVMVKGSAGMRMGVVVEALLRSGEPMDNGASG